MIGELNETRASIISLFVKEKNPQTHLMIFNIRSSINHIEVLISISSKLSLSDMFIFHRKKPVKLWKQARQDDFVISWVPIFCPCFGISLAFWYLFY